MNMLLVALLSALVGMVIGVELCRAYASKLRRENRKLRAMLKETGGIPAKMETMKKFVMICLLNGFAWVWCSYILACMDKTQIAESLSQVAVTQIIGVVLAYAVKSMIENLSKNNRWPDKGAAAPEIIMPPEPAAESEELPGAG